MCQLVTKHPNAVNLLSRNSCHPVILLSMGVLAVPSVLFGKLAKGCVTTTSVARNAEWHGENEARYKYEE
jgi:hypothetical protein